MKRPFKSRVDILSILVYVRSKNKKKKNNTIIMLQRTEGDVVLRRKVHTYVCIYFAVPSVLNYLNTVELPLQYFMRKLFVVCNRNSLQLTNDIIYHTHINIWIRTHTYVMYCLALGRRHKSCDTVNFVKYQLHKYIYIYIVTTNWL